MASTCSLTLSQVPPTSCTSLPLPLPPSPLPLCLTLSQAHTSHFLHFIVPPPHHFSWLNCSLLSWCQDPLQFWCQDPFPLYLFTPSSSLLSIHHSASQCRFCARCESLHLHQEDSNQMASDSTWWWGLSARDWHLGQNRSPSFSWGKVLLYGTVSQAWGQERAAAPTL